MTYGELKNDVARLGFEEQIDDENELITAANQALRLIFTDRPAACTVRRYVTAPRIAQRHPAFRHCGGEEITLPLCGVAFSFFTGGCGSYLLKDGAGETRVDFTPADGAIKGRLSGEGSITFLGDYDYTVFGLCSFLGVGGPELSDIPEYAPYVELDTDLDANDFRAFAGLPRDSRGRTLECATMKGGRIFLPFEYEGEIVYEYYRSPREITRSSSESIDIAAECEVLLPLLTAFLMWLDDDPDKASYYLSLYREELSRILRYSRSSVDNSYATDGWA